MVNVGENLINIVFAFVLVGSYGVLGLGASYAIAYVVSALWVLQILPYKVPGFELRAVLGSLGRMVVAAALMGEAMWLVTRALGRQHRHRGARAPDRRHRGRRRGLRGLARADGSPRAGRPQTAIAGTDPGGRRLTCRDVQVPEEAVEVPVAKLTGRFEANADPKVQLEQAIGEAQNQHKRLKEQATNVIAGQKQAEIRLNRKMNELEKLNANARQALIMATDAEKAGNADKAAQYTRAAETIADKLIQVESDVESLKSMVLESTEAADQAKAAVQQNSRLLQEKIAEKSKLVSQLEQAKMQEEMNSAMDQLNETVGDDVPTLNEVTRRSRPATPRRRRPPSSRRSRRVPRARDRAGHRQRRGAEPPLRAAGRARPRHRRPADRGRGRRSQAAALRRLTVPRAGF